MIARSEVLGEGNEDEGEVIGSARWWRWWESWVGVTARVGLGLILHFNRQSFFFFIEIFNQQEGTF